MCLPGRTQHTVLLTYISSVVTYVSPARYVHNECKRAYTCLGKIYMLLLTTLPRRVTCRRPLRLQRYAYLTTVGAVGMPRTNT